MYIFLDKLSFLKQKENDFVHEDSAEEEQVGRGQRKRIRKVLPGEASDDEDESSQTKKVKSTKVSIFG